MKVNRIDGSKLQQYKIIACLNAELQAKAGISRGGKIKIEEKGESNKPAESDTGDSATYSIAVEGPVDSDEPIITAPKVIEIPISALDKILGNFVGDIARMPVGSIIKLTKAPCIPSEEPDTVESIPDTNNYEDSH